MVNNANEILFRCSSLGHIMTEPQGKSNLEKYTEAKANADKNYVKYSEAKNKETKSAKNDFARWQKYESIQFGLFEIKDEIQISESCLTHLADLYTAIKFDRRREIVNKYFEKGNFCEEGSITTYSRFKKTSFIKNEAFFKNEFICGTPDIIKDGEVVDIKTSWDLITLNRNLVKDLIDMYKYQVLGYMALTGAKKGKVAYCLVNTPQHLIDAEKSKLKYRLPENELEAGYAEIDRLSLYDDIEIKDKVIEFNVVYDPDLIERIYERVKSCRQYINTNLLKPKP